LIKNEKGELTRKRAEWIWIGRRREKGKNGYIMYKGGSRIERAGI